MKALEKARGDRYETAALFGGDIERYLASEPIRARPAGPILRLRKFVRKNRAAVTTFGAVLLTFAIGCAVSIWFAVEAGRNFEEAGKNLSRAESSETKLRTRLAQVFRLSDVKNLADYRREAAELWPASSANVEKPGGMGSTSRACFERVRRSIARLLQLFESRRCRLEPQAREKPASREPGGFASTEDAWWHETLTALVADLESFEETFGDVERRLEFARTVRRKTIDEPRDLWDRAIASIRFDLPVYRGLKILPQEGLIPIGRDPDSGLWEFAHIQSGDVPTRGTDGRLTLTESMGLVFVLLPGGSFRMGANRPKLGVSAREESGRVIVEQVHEGTLAAELGILVGDQIDAVSGTPISTKEGLARALSTFASGQDIEVAVTRGAVESNQRRGVLLKGEIGPNVDPRVQENNSPAHEVTLAPFLMSKFEMTQSQWERVSGENPSQHRPRSKYSKAQRSGLNPVEQVTWFDGEKVLRQLGLVLPTGAQWEYGARGGTTTVWWTGSERESSRGKFNLADASAARIGARWQAIQDWLELDDGFATHAPVGTYPANPFGLHEVAGNVFEWTRDVNSTYKHPARPGDGLRESHAEGDRSIRGGAYTQTVNYARSASRELTSPKFRGNAIGLRPARALDL